MESSGFLPGPAIRYPAWRVPIAPPAILKATMAVSSTSTASGFWLPVMAVTSTMRSPVMKLRLSRTWQPSHERMPLPAYSLLKR